MRPVGLASAIGYNPGMEPSYCIFLAGIVCWLLVVIFGLAGVPYAVRAARLHSSSFTFWEAFGQGWHIWDRKRFTDEGWIFARIAQRYARWSLVFAAGFVASVLIGGLLQHYGL
jgi:hypothetical protein